MTTGTPAGDKRPSSKQLLAVAVWGGGTTLVAFLLSFGSIPLFVVNIAVIAVGVRLATRAIVSRRGGQLPPWWWL